MKKLSILSLVLAVTVAFSACDKADMGPVANTKSPGAPAIQSPESGQSFTLSRDKMKETAITIEWTKPDYGYAAAANYQVQLDEAGNDFANAQEVASVDTTMVGVTVGDLNQMLLAMKLSAGQAHNLELRVTASISDSVTKAVSEPVSISVTPFQTDFPPIYMIGSAVGGWSLDQARIVPSTEPKVYSTLAEFTNGGAFRFFGQQDWGPDSWNYPYFADNGGDIDQLLVNANDNDSNFQFTGSTGWYKVTVNMDDYSVQLEQAEEPIMYMAGSFFGNWSTPGSSETVKMDFVQPGVFEATTDFESGAFRFFGQAGWLPDSYNYPYFANNDGTIDELLENANDNDSNFQFTGSSGSYHVKVNINDYKVEMEAAN